MVQYSTRSNLKGSGTVNSTSAMSTDEPPADPYNYSADRGTQFVSLFFLIFLVLLFLLCIYCFCRWCGRRRRRRQRRAAALISILSGGADAQLHELQNVDAGLESSVIASLPTFTRQKQSCCSQDSDRPEVALECAVCLSAIGEGEVGRLLPNCGHVFHVECIDVWLGVNSTCPVCRREVVPVKEVAPAAGTVHADHLGSSETTTTSTSGSRLRPDELQDVVGDASGDEPANADGAVMTKEIGSTSRSATSFRKMVDRDSSEPRRLAPGVGEDDVERHIYMI